MKVYTRTLNGRDLHAAMQRAHEAGTVPAHVDIEELSTHRTQTPGLYAFTFRLASATKLPGDKRRRRNSGSYGADELWAATHDEHGHWMAQVFEADPDAAIGWSPRTPQYTGRADFHAKTEGAYAIPAVTR